MTLSRKRPFPSHDWPDSDADYRLIGELESGPAETLRAVRDLHQRREGEGE